MENKSVVLYSTGCPKCSVLKTKLDSKRINYTTVTDTNVMLSKGIDTVPVLEVDGKFLSFSEAVDWLKNIYN